MTAIGSSLMIIATYLLGAIPWGVVLGRVIKGIDVRSYGSGGTGATNSLRVLGWPISRIGRSRLRQSPRLPGIAGRRISS
jgi:glycerol-3-phosphate acyltransferase PlsY